MDAVGTEPAGATNGAIGSGVTAFRTKVPTAAGARGGIIRIQIGAVSSLGGVGVINRSAKRARSSFFANEPAYCAIKTPTNHAAEAIETAEAMFADEIGATLDLSPPAKAALIATITAAIQAGVAEERERSQRL